MIRQAESKDLSCMMEMYEAGLKELGETNIIESMIQHVVIEAYKLAPCFLLEKDGIVIGMAGLTVMTPSHNCDVSLTDYMFYVQPDHRNLKNLSDLVEQSKAFAESINLPLRLEFATETSEGVRERLFKMHGFRVCIVIGVYNE